MNAVDRRLPRLRLVPLYLALVLGRVLSSLLRRFPKRDSRLPHWQRGITILIPERSTAKLLETCLESAHAAAAQFAEPVEFIVMVNGSALNDYQHLQRRLPRVRWLHSPKPLGFAAAVARGISHAAYDWVYLLNSDMTVEPDALREAATWRGAHVFAIGSQISFADPARRREETGWTDYRTGANGVEIFDVLPDDEETVRGHLYAGGGASLYRRKLLERVMTHPDPYYPFYWEDVEWGVRAWRAGYEVLFCPRSRVTHVHRATVNHFYAPREIDRIFRRNALLCDVRNHLSVAGPRQLMQQIRGIELKSQTELASPRRAIAVFRALWRNARAPHPKISLRYLRRKFYPRPLSERSSRPVLLFVAPYAVWPPAHGGAKRITQLVKYLAIDFEVVFLGDEEKLYPSKLADHFKGMLSIHLVGGRPDECAQLQDRISRIQTHSHELLKHEAHRLASCYQARLVQIEHIELAGLIDIRRDHAPWFLTLHDVLLSEDATSREDRFETKLMRRYTGVIACSPEDANLLDGLNNYVVPNGAELNGSMYRPSAGKHTMLFLGPFRYRPNLQGIREFLEKVYPTLTRAVPEVRLEILGGSGAVEAVRWIDCFHQPGVRVHDQVDDVHPWLEEAALTINPLSGTRGSSIKLIESVAAGRICISTISGARGFTNLGVVSLIRVPHVDDFLEPLRNLLSNESERLRLERPSAEALAQVSWSRSAGIQAAFYRDHLNL